MKTIGLIGGMSWESTLPYYRVINEIVADRLGGLHSAELLLHSVDFDPIERLQHEDRWEEAGEVLVSAARHAPARRRPVGPLLRYRQDPRRGGRAPRARRGLI